MKVASNIRTIRHQVQSGIRPVRECDGCLGGAYRPTRAVPVETNFCTAAVALYSA
jgi:hypothetical protein